MCRRFALPWTNSLPVRIKSPAFARLNFGILARFSGDNRSITIHSKPLEEIAMSATLVRETQAAYRRLRRFVPLGVLRSEKDYRRATAMIDEIIDKIGQDESNPLADMDEDLGMIIHYF